jgi:hypothetical protein
MIFKPLEIKFETDIKKLIEKHGTATDKRMKECGGDFRLYITKTIEESWINLERILKIKLNRGGFEFNKNLV